MRSLTLKLTLLGHLYQLPLVKVVTVVNAFSSLQELLGLDLVADWGLSVWSLQILPMPVLVSIQRHAG